MYKTYSMELAGRTPTEAILFNIDSNSTAAAKSDSNAIVLVFNRVFNEKLGSGFDEKIILIGVGNLGQALLNYNRWDYVVGEVVMAFDINPEVLGVKNGVPIYHVDELEQRIPSDCHIAIITVSQDCQQLVDRLAECGITGLIDFTHQHFKVPRGVILKEIDVVSNIQELIFETNSAKKFK